MVLYSQLETFSNKYFHQNRVDSERGHSSQNALLNLLKNCLDKCLDTSGVVGTILMGLSKAYYRLPHDLLIAKPATYDFDNTALALIIDYLTNRLQWLKIEFRKYQY